ncbi:MAG TPA: hypothetical protein VGA96_00225 [Fibrella sp.]
MNRPKVSWRMAGWGLVLVGTFIANRLQAQSTTYEQQTANGTAPIAASAATIRSFNNSTVGLKGSPMLLPDWAPGEIILQSGKTITTGQVNYDVFNRQVAVKHSARDSVRYESAMVKQLILHPAGDASPLRYEHVPNLVTDEAALKTELLRIIHQGAYSLVELPIKTFIKAPAKQVYGGLGEMSNEYRNESVYYLVRPDQTAERVKLSRKSLVRALKEKGSSFESYLKANSVDLDNEQEVAKALASLDLK